MSPNVYNSLKSERCSEGLLSYQMLPGQPITYLYNLKPLVCFLARKWLSVVMESVYWQTPSSPRVKARASCSLGWGCLSSLASSVSAVFSLARSLPVFVNHSERPETQQNLGHALIVFMLSLPLSEVFVFH